MIWWERRDRRKDCLGGAGLDNMACKMLCIETGQNNERCQTPVCRRSGEAAACYDGLSRCSGGDVEPVIEVDQSVVWEDWAPGILAVPCAEVALKLAAFSNSHYQLLSLSACRTSLH